MNIITKQIMDNKEFLSKEQCLSLSELNYDGDYDYVYHATGELWERGKKEKKERFVPAPLKQQVLRWFREKYELFQEIGVFIDDDGKLLFDFKIIDHPDKPEEYYDNYLYSTYEEAEDEAIDKLISICKQQDNE
jgi:hypothetical protein